MEFGLLTAQEFVASSELHGHGDPRSVKAYCVRAREDFAIVNGNVHAYTARRDEHIGSRLPLADDRGLPLLQAPR